MPATAWERADGTSSEEESDEEVIVRPKKGAFRVANQPAAANPQAAKAAILTDIKGMASEMQSHEVVAQASAAPEKSAEEIRALEERQRLLQQQALAKAQQAAALQAAAAKVAQAQSSNAAAVDQEAEQRALQARQAQEEAMRKAQAEALQRAQEQAKAMQEAQLKKQQEAIAQAQAAAKAQQEKAQAEALARAQAAKAQAEAQAKKAQEEALARAQAAKAQAESQAKKAQEEALAKAQAAKAQAEAQAKAQAAKAQQEALAKAQAAKAQAEAQAKAAQAKAQAEALARANAAKAQAESAAKQKQQSQANGSLPQQSSTQVKTQQTVAQQQKPAPATAAKPQPQTPQKPQPTTNQQQRFGQQPQQQKPAVATPQTPQKPQPQQQQQQQRFGAQQPAKAQPAQPATPAKAQPSTPQQPTTTSRGDMKFEPQQQVGQPQASRVPTRAPVKVQAPPLEFKAAPASTGLNPSKQLKETAKVQEQELANETTRLPQGVTANRPHIRMENVVERFIEKEEPLPEKMGAARAGQLEGAVRWEAAIAEQDNVGPMGHERPAAVRLQDDSCWMTQHRVPVEVQPPQVGRITIPELTDEHEVHRTIVVAQPQGYERVKWNEFPEEFKPEIGNAPKVKTQEWVPVNQEITELQRSLYTPARIARAWPPPEETVEKQQVPWAKTKATGDQDWIHQEENGVLKTSAWTSTSKVNRAWPPPEEDVVARNIDAAHMGAVQWPPSESEASERERIEVLQKHIPAKKMERQWPPPPPQYQVVEHTEPEEPVDQDRIMPVSAMRRQQ